MKIKKFNESLDDDFTYKGELIFGFKVKRKTLVNNANALYSDRFLKERGMKGVLYEYVKHLESESDNKHLYGENEDIKLKYKIYDKEGNVVDEKIFDEIEKYNL